MFLIIRVGAQVQETGDPGKNSSATGECQTPPNISLQTQKHRDMLHVFMMSCFDVQITLYLQNIYFLCMEAYFMQVKCLL